MKKQTHWWLVIQKASGRSANGQVYYTRRAAMAFLNQNDCLGAMPGYRKEDRQVIKVVRAERKP